MKIHEVKAAIQKNIDHEQAGIDVYEHVLKVLSSFEGKQITKRMATALEKNLPAGYNRAYINRIGSLIQIVVVPKNFSNRITFLLGYDSHPYFSVGRSEDQHSGFAYFNNCHGEAAKQRNEIRRNLLSKAIKLTGLANTFAEAKKTAAAAREELSELVGYTMDVEIPKALGMWGTNL